MLMCPSQMSGRVHFTWNEESWEMDWNAVRVQLRTKAVKPYASLSTSALYFLKATTLPKLLEINPAFKLLDIRYRTNRLMK